MCLHSKTDRGTTVGVFTIFGADGPLVPFYDLALPSERGRYKQNQQGTGERLSFLQEDEETLNYRLRCAAHVVTYLILVLLLGITRALGGLPYWPLTVVLGWSWVDEATKPLVRGRHFSWRDVGLNWLGCGLGFAFLWLCR